MKIQLACLAALAGVACSPSETPAPAAPAPAASPTAAISLAGAWAGSITCYKIEGPLQMTIDAAKPGEAAMSKGENGALGWPATVAVNGATGLVTIRSVGPNDGAEMIEGVLSEDGSTISGVMDRQLCTDFTLKRTG